MCYFRNSCFQLFTIILLAALLIVFWMGTQGSAQQNHEGNILENVQKEAALDQGIRPESIETYIADMQKVCASEDSEPTELDCVFVLAGRGTYARQAAGFPSPDREDDWNRTERGIAVARKITALRSGKRELTLEDMEKHGPTIIYNGAPLHNEHLKKALEEGELTHYPKTKFLILELDPQDVTTRGEFRSLKEAALPLKKVAIVTHAYHCPRVARLVSSQWNPFAPDTSMVFYPVDTELKAPGVTEDLLSEMKKIPLYIARGNLGPEMAPTIKFCKHNG